MTLDDLEDLAVAGRDYIVLPSELALALIAAIRGADAMRDTTLPGTSDQHYAACLDYDAKRRECEA